MSGESIERERLKTIPCTRFSLAAEPQLEARGLSNRPQLGNLGSYLKGSDSEEPAEDESEETTSRRAEPEAAWLVAATELVGLWSDYCVPVN